MMVSCLSGTANFTVEEGRIPLFLGAIDSLSYATLTQRVLVKATSKPCVIADCLPQS